MLTLIHYVCYCRHIHTDLSMWVVTVKDNLLATSMSVMSEEEEPDEDDLASPSIFVHDVQELVNPEIKTDKLYKMELKCPIEHYSDPHICLNQTSLFAITKNSKSEGTTIHHWDFWSYN